MNRLGVGGPLDAGVLLSLLAVAALLGCAEGPDATKVAGPAWPCALQEFIVSVRLSSPFKRGSVLEAATGVGGPFSALALSGAVRNTISGVLRAPDGDRYPLDLTLGERLANGHGVTDTTTISLRPGEPYDWGVISGLVWGRTVSLRRKSP